MLLLPGIVGNLPQSWLLKGELPKFCVYFFNLCENGRVAAMVFSLFDLFDQSGIQFSQSSIEYEPDKYIAIHRCLCYKWQTRIFCSRRKKLEANPPTG
jgi:hypothetical protein